MRSKQPRKNQSVPEKTTQNSASEEEEMLRSYSMSLLELCYEFKRGEYDSQREKGLRGGFCGLGFGNCEGGMDK